VSREKVSRERPSRERLPRRYSWVTLLALVDGYWMSECRMELVGLFAVAVLLIFTLYLEEWRAWFSV
jgi:hypothetical protein